MPYPPRPQLRALPGFAGTARSRPNPSVQARVEAFVLAQYAAGRSLREIAELARHRRHPRAATARMCRSAAADAGTMQQIPARTTIRY